MVEWHGFLSKHSPTKKNKTTSSLEPKKNCFLFQVKLHESLREFEDETLPIPAMLYMRLKHEIARYSSAMLFPKKGVT